MTPLVCPFCKQPPEVQTTPDFNFVVSCENPQCTAKPLGLQTSTRDEAITQWNYFNYQSQSTQNRK